jgi:hypothetical protein
VLGCTYFVEGEPENENPLPQAYSKVLRILTQNPFRIGRGFYG